jgi:NADPH:quinone reductase-like Zn-dependent oxidoreductase
MWCRGYADGPTLKSTPAATPTAANFGAGRRIAANESLVRRISAIVHRQSHCSRPHRGGRCARQNDEGLSSRRVGDGSGIPMKAIVQHEYGRPDVLEFENIDTPVVKDDEVLVRVHAAGVDPGVWHLMTGLPYLVRIMGFGLRKPKARVRGDVAGRVEAVGKDVATFQPGDEVFGTCDGAFAEYACARTDKVALKPATLTFEQAAAVPISACTALQGLRDKGQIQPGQTVLIIGAAGGVGTFAVQLANMFAAEVTGVCSTTKVDLVRSIGADHVVDYTREDFTDGRQRYDLILDTAGRRSLSHLRRALATRGRLIIVGGEGGGRWLGGFDRGFRGLALSPLIPQQVRPLSSTQRQEDLQFLKGAIEAGAVTPVIDRTYPLSETASAIAYVAEGHARGKVILTI